jgi:hypothetical protein
LVGMSWDERRLGMSYATGWVEILACLLACLCVL